MISRTVFLRSAIVIGVVAGAAWLTASRLHSPDADKKRAATATRISVQVGALKRMTLHRYVTGYGTVMAAPATARQPAAFAAVASPVTGVVTRLDVAPGQRVRRGQLLAELNSGTMTERYAEREAARQERLYAQHNTSLKALQAAQAQLTLLRVTAPLSGTVVNVAVAPGTAVNTDTVLLKIVNLHRLVVTTDIPAMQATQLQPGQPLEVLQPSLTVPLAYISPAVDPADGSIMAWAPLPANSGLRPGQFVRLRITVGVQRNALAAPAESVITGVSGTSFISLVQDDQAVRTPVKTGYRESGWVQVSGPGLKAGDPVVTIGAYGLPRRTQIRITHPDEAATASAKSQIGDAQ